MRLNSWHHNDMSVADIYNFAVAGFDDISYQYTHNVISHFYSEISPRRLTVQPCLLQSITKIKPTKMSSH